MSTPLVLVSLLLCACTAPPAPRGASPGPKDSAAVDTADPADSAAPDSAAPLDTAWWQADPEDPDGDGITGAAGDCDPLDPAVYPGAADTICDGIDNNCDGSVDEGFDADPDEPNDEEPTALGDLGAAGEVLTYAYLFPKSDEDRYTFTVADADFAWFDVEVWLYDVPADADYSLELIWRADTDGVDHGTVDRADAHGLGGEEMAEYPGEAWADDSGRYEVVVRSTEGDGCATPYTLQVLVGSW